MPRAGTAPTVRPRGRRNRRRAHRRPPRRAPLLRCGARARRGAPRPSSAQSAERHPVERTTPPNTQPAQPPGRAARRRYTRRVTRRELIDRTRQLVEEGERIVAAPSLSRLRLWLKVSDDLLSAAWGTMDRYHLAWLMVGRPTDVARGRPLTPAEEAAYVREVARAKTAALRMSLDALERLGIPFLGEDPEPSRPGPSRPEPGRP